MSKKIEDVINSKIKSGAQRDALDFIAHLQRSENISISSDDNDEGRWWIRDKDNLLCEIQLKTASDDSPDGWEVWFYGDCIGAHDSLVDEDVKKIAWANITLCGNCGAGCAPGKRKTVFGKIFENVCQSTLGFSNPETDVVCCMKKIMETINSNTDKHPPA